MSPPAPHSNHGNHLFGVAKLQPEKYQGKDWNPTASFNVCDFGARQYDPFTARWLSPDPLAEKYYGHSPYLFCAGSPINFVDPRGEIWDNPQSVRMLEHYTNLRLQELSSQKEVLQKRIESGLFSNDVVDSFLSSIIELDKQTEYLRQSLSDIEYLANDLTNTYVLDAVLKPDHNVRIGPNNRVFIETSSDAISLHEISHVRQALNAGRLTFNSEGKLLNPGKNLNEMIKNEVEAYRIQYSFDPLSFPGVLYGSPGIDGINRKSVIEIKFNGQYAYPFLNYQH